jgi:hypothetical protein
MCNESRGSQPKRFLSRGGREIVGGGKGSNGRTNAGIDVTVVEVL